MLRHQKDVVLEEPALNILAFARVASLVKCSENGNRAEHAAHHIVDGRARTHRPAFAASHVGETAHHLHNLIERSATLIRAGQKPLVRTIDDLRPQFLYVVVSQPKLIHRAGAEILTYYIDTSDEFE
jgi:hypothetical protein